MNLRVQHLVEILLSDERLEVAVLRLSPLPHSQVPLNAVHSRLKKGSLTQVLAVFAESLKQGLLSGHEDIGTLVALSSLLKQRHAELLQEIQGKLFFSEMASSSPLHQLLVVLFEQARSPHKQVREASLHCLGILGPVEWHLPCLSTAHWNPISGMVDEADKGCQDITYAFIFRRMECYLSHPDTKLSHAACQALKSALATPAGFDFASQHRLDGDMKDIFSLLHPFVPSRYDVCPRERPVGATDHSQLWAPEDACDHATWITNLVCTLIRCCNDHVLWALLPLCTMAVDLCELLLPLVVETLADEGTHWNAVVSGMATFLQCHAQLKDDAQKSQSTVVSEPMSTEVTSGQVYCSQASVAVLMSAVERMLVRRDAKTSEDGGLLHWSAVEAAPVQSVLVASLSGLGDLDALTGCRCLALGAHFPLWRHWAEQQGAQWPTLLAQADLEATGRNARLGHALKQCGLYNTLTAYVEPGTPDLTELQAECAWRLANWDCRLPQNDQGRSSRMVIIVRPEQRRVIHLRWTMMTNMKSSADKRGDHFFVPHQNSCRLTAHFIPMVVMLVLPENADNQRAQDISDVHWLATVVNVLTLWCLAENFKEKSAIRFPIRGSSENLRLQPPLAEGSHLARLAFRSQ
ncbi:serine-protein kinase ATM [Rhipicephalus sanguineus]|uniref:serine-protein kinase ATM n=1 Tax=Rhipicephalus sanguineus TaxID=34632 RepID=UPI0020C2EB70|nr:serine-protein kinase ATM [Rhipicephalus sanguineus]